MFEQAASKEVALSGADLQVKSQVGKLDEFLNFTQHVIDQLSKSPTFTAPVNRLLKQDAIISIITESKVYDHNTN